MEWLGEYELRKVLGRAGDLHYYEAFQPAINRLVALVLLDPESATPEREQEFLTTARMRARVSDPFLTSVYEAVIDQGYVYYTRELLSGRRVDELLEAGVDFSETELLRLVDAVLRCCSVFERAGFSMRPLKETMIYWEKDGGWRMLHPLQEGQTAADHMPRALEMLLMLVRSLHRGESELKAGLEEASRLVVAGEARGWADLQEFWERYRHRWGLTMAPLRKVKRLPKGVLIGVGAGLLCLVGLGWGVKVVRDRQRAHLPALAAPLLAEVQTEKGVIWFSVMEVSIGEYVHFLKAAQELGDFDSPDQPEGKKDHTPPDWELMLASVQHGKPYRQVQLGYDSPVFNVDYWDAWAFARWRGGRLPTEEEWQAGAEGCVEEAKDEEDVKGWQPVSAMSNDGSRAGLRGLVGNVAEWTDSFAMSVNDPGLMVPVVRGGDFTRAGAQGLSRRLLSLRSEDRELFVGLRVVYDQPPATARFVSGPPEP